MRSPSQRTRERRSSRGPPAHAYPARCNSTHDRPCLRANSVPGTGPSKERDDRATLPYASMCAGVSPAVRLSDGLPRGRLSEEPRAREGDAGGWYDAIGVAECPPTGRLAREHGVADDVLGDTARRRLRAPLRQRSSIFGRRSHAEVEARIADVAGTILSHARCCAVKARKRDRRAQAIAPPLRPRNLRSPRRETQRCNQSVTCAAISSRTLRHWLGGGVSGEDPWRNPRRPPPSAFSARPPAGPWTI